jgi:hypothetical protein
MSCDHCKDWATPDGPRFCPSCKKRHDDKSRKRLKKPAWRDSLVQRVMDGHNMTEEQAIQAIIDFGG